MFGGQVPKSIVDFWKVVSCGLYNALGINKSRTGLYETIAG